MLHQIDAFDLPGFTSIAARFGQEHYGFVVTPNIDHLIRYHDDPTFRDHYAAASFVLMDSRVASRLIRLTQGVTLPVCTGSDLTQTLFRSVIAPSDRIVLIGGSSEQAERLRQQYNLQNLRQHVPPMGFIRDPDAVETALRFIEDSSPFRFCFLAVGSPQQEALAHALKIRGQARGLALCVGASLNFMTGAERRAPRWMQHAGLEWLYRLLQDPRRLARRYLVRGPRFFSLLRHSRFQARRPA